MKAPAATTPQVTVMDSTPVPSTTVHRDGTTTTGTVLVVHAPGAILPAQGEHPCGPRCSRCRS